MANGNIKIIFGAGFDTKIIAKAHLASLTAFLWFKHSRNALCSQPETNHMFNRLATSISQHKM